MKFLRVFLCSIPLSFLSADDFPDSLGLAHSISSGQTVAGEIERDADRDLFSFLAVPYVIYWVRMDPETNSLRDAEVRVYDPATNLLLRVSSTGGRSNAVADLPAGTRLRRVYVDARAFAEYEKGHYTLSVSIPPGSVVDGDEDDLPDAFEDAFGLSTASSGPEDLHGALGDADGDGLSNYDEMLAGTHPLQSSSVVKVTLLELDELGNAAVEWPVIPGASYLLQSSDGLLPFLWTDLITLRHTGAVAEVFRFGPIPDDFGAKKMFRVLYLPD